ncbi:hypothetical protein Dshi_0641 [Dinoroseobacter shibae DFL 12 = DSM 16493]|jgi:hypothetical protein|uniref:Uncharacterized protein n=1 Tax=Dinoroseobacter shibae (strain DSM 16493 / NCIMB 14021 / DFL 12) TaxID=398580 RepID=A8LQA1_DINSH|nr:MULTISPECIES: hypothetical protein [Dinoroseobacter]ABV92387.1 hypothetical protein Dshi_0641 [Dinoroseobacter shibae DFL 12 = DSM 16493]MDD9718357.1 hypothetical protein [Dinoroseobacter sp. PD6]URF47333.1 hypothetical protein M8008_03315 [Dinoroseobacter shibae]URF51644.1 hypothetical protein M8007_03315 [Dinoroseobacter shibae]
MMIKAVTIFLVGMAILAMFGKLRLPYIGRVSLKKPVKCKSCGRYLLSSDPCSCGKG